MAERTVEPEGQGSPAYELWRAADIDRRRVASLLQQAVNEGRLTLHEYDERVATVYAARTYAELNTVLEDLPPASRAALAVPPQDAPHPPRPKARTRIPTALLVLWTIWGSIVAVNVAIWLVLLVAVTGPVYPWPVWVAVPPGAALLAVTIGVQAIRRSRG